MAEMMKNETKQRILISSIMTIDLINTNINKYLKCYNNHNFPSELLQFLLYVNMLDSDFAVLTKQYCKADQRWEEILIAQQFYIKLNESVKKIIGFDPKGRKKSYWISSIGSYTSSTPNHIIEFDMLCGELIGYAEKSEQTMIKYNRDISVHGDENYDSISHFKALNKISMDETIMLFVEWGTLLKKVGHSINNELERLLKIRITEGVAINKTTK